MIKVKISNTWDHWINRLKGELFVVFSYEFLTFQSSIWSIKLRILLFIEVLLSLFKRVSVLLFFIFWIFFFVLLDLLANASDDYNDENECDDSTDNGNSDNPALDSTLAFSIFSVRVVGFSVVFDWGWDNLVACNVGAALDVADESVVSFTVALSAGWTCYGSLHECGSFPCLFELSEVRVLLAFDDVVDICSDGFELFAELVEWHIEFNDVSDWVLTHTEVSDTEDVSWFAWETVFRFINTSKTVVITTGTVSWILFLFLDHVWTSIADVTISFTSTSLTVIGTFGTFLFSIEIIVGGTLGTVGWGSSWTWHTVGFSCSAWQTSVVLWKIILLGTDLTIGWLSTGVKCLVLGLVGVGFVCCAVGLTGWVVCWVGIGGVVRLWLVVAKEILSALSISLCITSITLNTHVTVWWTVETVCIWTPFSAHSLNQIVPRNTCCTFVYLVASLALWWTVHTLVITSVSSWQTSSHTFVHSFWVAFCTTVKTLLTISVWEVGETSVAWSTFSICAAFITSDSTIFTSLILHVISWKTGSTNVSLNWALSAHWGLASDTLSFNQTESNFASFTGVQDVGVTSFTVVRTLDTFLVLQNVTFQTLLAGKLALGTWGTSWLTSCLFTVGEDEITVTSKTNLNT